MSIFIIDLHELNIIELFEIQCKQISNVEVLALRGAHAFEIDVRNTVVYFQFAVACKAVVDADPAVGVFLCCAGTFEECIESGFIHNIGFCPTYACALDRRRVQVVAELARKINIDLGIQRRRAW